MAELTLGLDVGPNSIGWVLVDQIAPRILSAGVRVFPEGVDRDQQGGEKSKTQSRRDARGMRRQIRRRARRRRLLREALTHARLLPSDPEALQQLLALNPYQLRRRALEEKLDLHEIGRILLHLNQRRGFLSNRKTDKAKDKDNKGILAEMNELAAAMKQATSPTLGSYFAELDRTFNRCAPGNGPHIRGRHTRRTMYEEEFEKIWTEQQKHYPEVLTDALKYGARGNQVFPKIPQPLGKQSNIVAEYGIYGLIFFQRKMYWPKSVVGRCELEPREKRCPRAARAAQRFRILQEVNNLRLLDRSTREQRGLSATERETLVKHLMATKEATFDQIRNWLRLPETVRFNFERGGRKKLQGHLPDAALGGKKCLGKRWSELPESIKNDVVDILIEEDVVDETVRRLLAECGLTEEEAKCAAAVHLPEGYMNFSRRAIDRLLPHLEKGLMLMADDATNSALHAAGYLRPDERAVNQRRFLPPSPNVTNPIVRQALVEVRKTVNAILRELVYRQGHTLGHLHIELAREAKKSFDERTEMRFENARREQERADTAKRIEEFDASIKPTRATVNRYLLWKEQEESCPYCGEKISMPQLFSGEADIDHILPRWRSLDDSTANKVVAHRRCNHEKGDRTPRQWLEDSDPERYERVLRVAERLSYGKQLKFQQKDIVLDDFVHRQLNDTAYISRCVSQYLRCLGATVVCTRGDMTAGVRHWWGLNSILQEDGSNRKNREDHRHHAIDALVVALTDEKRLFALANARGENMPPPWKGFRQEAESLILGINVSHRVQRRLHGALHEDTFYGPTQKALPNGTTVEQGSRPWGKDWIEDEQTYVRRKSVESLTKTQDLEKVRDPTIREILRAHLRNLPNGGVDPDKPGKIPGDAFKGKNTPRMPSGVPIRKVRMIEQSLTFRKVSARRSYQYVKPGNNHHVVYRSVTKAGRQNWKAEVVTMWDAAARARKGLPLVDQSDRDHEKFVMSLSIGEMFEIDATEGGRLLCVVRKLDQRSKRVNYKLHTDAREAGEIDKDHLYLSPSQMQARNARKITVDPIGQIRRAEAKLASQEISGDSSTPQS